MIKYIIERKTFGPEWERFAFPKYNLEIVTYNLEIAKSLLNDYRTTHKNATFRLIEESRKVLDE